LKKGMRARKVGRKGMGGGKPIITLRKRRSHIAKKMSCDNFKEKSHRGKKEKGARRPSTERKIRRTKKGKDVFQPPEEEGGSRMTGSKGKVSPRGWGKNPRTLRRRYRTSRLAKGEERKYKIKGGRA